MGMCRGHGEEELSITGAEDDAEEKVKLKKNKNSKCTSRIFGVLKCDKKSCSFSIDSISVKVIWSLTSDSKSVIHLALKFVFRMD